MCVCVCSLGIVSTDNILRFTDSFVIIKCRNIHERVVKIVHTKTWDRRLLPFSVLKRQRNHGTVAKCWNVSEKEKSATDALNASRTTKLRESVRVH